MKRREFLKSGVLATLAPSLGFAAPFPKREEPTLVFVFMNGGADLLSFLPPLEDSEYARLRPKIGIKRESGPIKLTSPFYLHPRAKDLLPLWKSRELGFVLRTGLSVPVRSHSEAQFLLESGTTDEHSRDGFLYRAIAHLPREHRIPAVAISPRSPRSLMGDKPVFLSFSKLKRFDLVQSSRAQVDPRVFQALYAGREGQVEDAAHWAFAAMKELEPVRKSPELPAFLARFQDGEGSFAPALGEIAWMIKSRPDIPIFVAESAPWDTHAKQGAETGAAADVIGELCSSLLAFRQALGRHWERVVFVAVTEFGRTVAENGSAATDHGHGSLAIVAGGRVRGGKMYGSWDELKKANLFEERDLHVTTDIRAVLAEILSEHLGVSRLDQVFPGFSRDPKTKLHLLRT